MFRWIWFRNIVFWGVSVRVCKICLCFYFIFHFYFSFDFIFLIFIFNFYFIFYFLFVFIFIFYLYLFLFFNPAVHVLNIRSHNIKNSFQLGLYTSLPRETPRLRTVPAWQWNCRLYISTEPLFISIPLYCGIYMPCLCKHDAPSHLMQWELRLFSQQGREHVSCAVILHLLLFLLLDGLSLWILWVDEAILVIEQS